MFDPTESGRRIRALRTKAGLSIAELGEIVSLTRSAMNMIELGKDTPGLPVAVALADYFKVPLDWLLARPLPHGGPLVGKFVERGDELSLLRFWGGLEVEDKRAVVRTLRISDIDLGAA